MKNITFLPPFRACGLPPRPAATRGLGKRRRPATTSRPIEAEAAERATLARLENFPTIGKKVSNHWKIFRATAGGLTGGGGVGR